MNKTAKLKDLKLNKKNLKTFLANLRNEDNEEMQLFFMNHSEDDFYRLCLKNKKTTYFLSDSNGAPVALGGANPDKSNNTKEGAIVWLLVARGFDKYKIELYKYVKDKIEVFKNRYKFLYNYIYKSNFASLNWLKRMGFIIVDANPDYKFFYRKGK